MENVELVTVSSDTDDDDDEGDQDDFRPLISGGQERPTGRRTRLIYDNPAGPDIPGGLRAGETGGCSWRKVCLSLLAAAIVVVCVFMFLTGRQEEAVAMTRIPSLDYMDFKQPKNLISYQDILEDNFRFNVSSSSDVMVFLHIQKTGGTTFGKHLVQDIDLARPCLCHKRRNRLNRRKLHCDCFRPGTEDSNWLFSRYSIGWKCGLHPDWTELTHCVDGYMSGLEGDQVERRYFYITFLREPLARYVSEYRHVKRGATWRDSMLVCNKTRWADIIPRCYEDLDGYGDWSGVSLSEFMNCPQNLALNRQTRMLADLELVDCYDDNSNMKQSTREAVMLASAKTNLERMAYFGLTEEQTISQYLFEETFNLEFKVQFEQYSSNETKSGATKNNLTPEVEEKILRLNHLDVELYKFAKSLIEKRFNSMKESDESFQDHMERLGKEKYEFSWNDIEDEDYEDEEDKSPLSVST